MLWWITSGLAQLLPEDLRRGFLFDYREQLKAEGINSLQLELMTFKLLLSSASAAVRNLPNVLERFLAWIDPRYPSVQIYKKFGAVAVERLEDEYLADSYRALLPRMRYCGPILIALNGLLSFLDPWSLPESYHTAWSIRIAACVFIAGVIGLSKHETLFRRFYQLVTFSMLLAAGWSTIAILAFSQSTEIGHVSYYAGLDVLILYASLMSGLRFYWAFGFSTAIGSSYLIVAWITNGALMARSSIGLFFFSSFFFLFNALVFAALSSNILERSERLDFTIRYALSHSLKDMLRYFEYKTPESFLLALSRMRYAPKMLTEFIDITYSSGALLPSSDYSTLSLNDSAAIKAIEASSTNVLSTDGGTSSISYFRKIGRYVRQWIERADPNKFWKGIYPIKEESLRRLEKEYSWNHYYGAVRSIRVLLLGTLFTFTSFVLDDYYSLPAFFGVAVYMRIGGVIVIFLLFLITFLESFCKGIYQYAMAGGGLYAGFAILAMIAFSKPGETAYTSYYCGLIESMFAMFFLCQMQFAVASISCGLLCIGYEIVALKVQHLTATAAGTALWINNSVFLFSALSIGIVASYIIDRNKWLEFLTIRSIAYKASEFLQYCESESLAPRQILDLLNDIRRSPQQLEKLLVEIETLKTSDC